MHAVHAKYPDSVAKVSLVYSVARQTKEQLVQQYGIGEELSMNIFGWKDDTLICVAQMDTTWPHNTEEDRHERVNKTATIMRQGWHINALTLVAEGYVSTNPEYSKPQTLADAYLNDTNNTVTECLSICHVDETDTEICAIPYKIVLRNNIEWKPLLHTQNPNTLRNNQYLHTLTNALQHTPPQPPTNIDTYQLALSTELANTQGFFLQYNL